MKFLIIFKMFRKYFDNCGIFNIIILVTKIVQKLMNLEFV